MLFAVILVFVYSIVGLPIGAVLFLFRHIAIIFGRIPIAIFFGIFAFTAISNKKEKHIYII